MSYLTSNYMAHGGALWVVGAELRIASGGSITAAGTQASKIADPTAGSLGSTRAKVIEIIDALEGVGVTAAT